MKRIIQHSAWLLIFMALSCSSTKSISSLKSQVQHQIDGLPGEWGQPIRFSDNDTGIQYAIENDTDHLYLIYRITDQQTIMKVLSAGAKLWLDPSGKGDKKMTIDFPLKKEMGRAPMVEHEKNRLIMMEDLLLQKNEAVLTGFLNGPSGKKALDSIGDFRFKVLINNDESLVYELAIPLNSLYAASANRNMPFDLGLEINGMEMPQRKGGSGGSGGRGPGGGRPPGGGGMGGGMHGGGGHGGPMPGGHSFESMTKAVKLQTKVLLSK
ncbi:hypothetical protein [Solitalea longa]|uniref:hypothetical protein n=1 Tax=Solitalea longa TaxID=2079460 RepID=UPI0013FE4BBD|nr:hypothetical protein [Solitalea longa]